MMCMRRLLAFVSTALFLHLCSIQEIHCHRVLRFMASHSNSADLHFLSLFTLSTNDWQDGARRAFDPGEAPSTSSEATVSQRKPSQHLLMFMEHEIINAQFKKCDRCNRSTRSKQFKNTCDRCNHSHQKH